MLIGLFLGGIFFVVGAFVLQGLRKIPADPPHKAVVTIFGKRVQQVKDEGWRFFPVCPWWYGFILVNVTKVNQDLPMQTVRTPDRAELNIPISLTWTPAYEIWEKTPEGETKRESPDLLIQYLNTGGEKGVKTILEDIVHERLREWAFSQEEGPQDWIQAMAAREEAIAILLKAILGEELTPVRAPFPTSVLLKYFATPQIPPNEHEEKRYGKNWEKITTDFSSNTDQKEETRKAVEERRTAIRRARQGNGHFACPQLGILINRLNVGEIKPLGELAKAAETEAKEQQERKGEVFEIETDLIKARQLVEAADKAGEKLSLGDAYRIVMEWKATREGRGFTIPGLAPEIARVAQKFFGR